MLSPLPLLCVYVRCSCDFRLRNFRRLAEAAHDFTVDVVVVASPVAIDRLADTFVLVPVYAMYVCVCTSVLHTLMRVCSNVYM